MRRRDNQPMHDEADFGLQLLEDELRTGRPVASAGLAASIADGLNPARTPKTASRQLGFAAALTATLAAALASVGGVSYAANAVTHAAAIAKSVVVTRVHVVGKGLTAGGDQYRPGFGFGDPNHNHTGPPGVTNGKKGEKAPPTQVAPTSGSWLPARSPSTSRPPSTSASSTLPATSSCSPRRAPRSAATSKARRRRRSTM